MGSLLIIVMGLILGVLGGGGSILTVPILVYLFEVPAVLATSYSLVIVGLTSLFGAVYYRRCGQLNWFEVGQFSIPAAVGVVLSRRYVLPLLPEKWLLLFFAGLIMVIAGFMLVSKESDEECPRQSGLSWLLIVEGIVVGGLTGIVGAGGGFMIVPALVMLGNMPLRQAIGTSLGVIALKSLVGFGGDLVSGLLVDWLFLSKLMGLTAVGMAMGVWLQPKLPTHLLRKGFGLLVFLLGVLMVVLEAL